MNKHIQANHPLEKRLTEPYELIEERDSTLASRNEQLEKKQITAKRVQKKISKPKETGNLIAERNKKANGGPPRVITSDNSVSDQPVSISAARYIKNDIRNSLNSPKASGPDNNYEDKKVSGSSIETTNHSKIELKTNINLGE